MQAAPGKISFIIDCWTSKNQWAFLGIIAQWIDTDWKLNSVVLDLKRLEGSHTGQNIAGAFIQSLNEFEILPKIGAVTTDNASNMDTFFVHLSSKLQEQVSLGLRFCSLVYLNLSLD